MMYPALILTDYMSSSEPIKPRTESRNANIGSRERLYSTPNILFVAQDDDTPKTKVKGLIKINNNYLDSEYVVNKKEAQNLNNLVSSFFHSDQPEIAPYTKKEWSLLLEKDETEQHDKLKLYSSLKHGLPEECRKDIWLYLAETERLKSEQYLQGITYEELKCQSCCLEEEKIKKDITRSFEDHELFRDQKEEKLISVENILRAYANFDPEVGYTQGMNFLAGMLFGIMWDEYSKHENQNGRQDINTEKIECEVFWMLVYIMREKNWRMIYVDNTPKLHSLLQEFEIRIKENLPNLHQTFLENACISACFTKYFLAIMLCHTPTALAKRILEAFLLVGEEILFHVLIKVLTACEQEILAQKDIGDLYCFLGEQLMKCASK